MRNTVGLSLSPTSIGSWCSSDSTTPRSDATNTTLSPPRSSPNSKPRFYQPDYRDADSRKVKQESLSPHSFLTSYNLDPEDDQLTSMDDIDQDPNPARHWNLHPDTPVQSIESDDRLDDDGLAAAAAATIMEMHFDELSIRSQEAAEAMLHLPFINYGNRSQAPSIDMDGDSFTTPRNTYDEMRDKQSEIARPSSEVEVAGRSSTLSTKAATPCPPPARRPSVVRLPMPVRESTPQMKRPFQSDQDDSSTGRKFKRVKVSPGKRRQVPVYMQERSSAFRLLCG